MCSQVSSDSFDSEDESPVLSLNKQSENKKSEENYCYSSVNTPKNNKLTECNLNNDSDSDCLVVEDFVTS